MRVKTFEAPTLEGALAQAKQELGEEAVALNTKEVKRRGVFGLGRFGRIALTAGSDRPAEVNSEQWTADCGRQPPALDPQPEIAELQWELQRLSLIVEGLLRPREMGHMGPMGSTPPLVTRLGIDEDVTLGPLSDLREITDPDALTSALAAKLQPFACPPRLDRPANPLPDAGSLHHDRPANPLPDARSLHRDRPANPLPDAGSASVIALVGPTGVGKTTTLAKLAARFSLEMGKKVALVTVDTFRIGAVEQLRTYARIMGLPLEVALSADDFAAGVEKHRDKDVVLVDTVGRGQRSDEHLKEIKSFLDAAHGVETHLVVAASLDPAIQREVVERFAIFSPVRLVVTKLDESPHRGALVNLPVRTGLGISCVTAGQNVPQDLESADAGLLARMVVEGAR